MQSSWKKGGQNWISLIPMKHVHHTEFQTTSQTTQNRGASVNSGIVDLGPQTAMCPPMAPSQTRPWFQASGGLVKWLLWWFSSSIKTPVPTLVLFYIVSQQSHHEMEIPGGGVWYAYHAYHSFFSHLLAKNRLHISKFPECSLPQKPWSWTVSAPGPPRASVDHPQARYRRGEPSCDSCALRNVATLPSKVHCFRSIQKLDEFARSQGDPKVQITWWFRDFYLWGDGLMKKNDLFREHHQIPEGALKWYWLTHRIKLEEMTGDGMSS